jgi:hypothetical protein
MKSALAGMLRWSSKKLAVAAEKIEISTVMADDAVKDTYVKMCAWVRKQRVALAAWFEGVAAKLEKSGSFWEWFKPRAGSIALGAISILFAINALLWLVSVFLNGFIGIIICLIFAVIYGCLAMAFWAEAEKEWTVAEVVAAEPAVTEKKPVAPVHMTSRQRKAATRAQRPVLVTI